MSTEFNLNHVLAQLRPDVKFDPGALRENAFIEALVAAINVHRLGDGFGGGLGLAASYEYSGAVTGDYSYITTTLFTPSASGMAVFAIFADETINAGGPATWNLEWQIRQGARVLASNGYGLAATYPYGLGECLIPATLWQADGAVYFEHRVTNFLTSPATAMKIKVAARIEV